MRIPFSFYPEDPRSKSNMCRITKFALRLAWVIAFALVVASCSQSQPESSPLADTPSGPDEQALPADATPAASTEEAASAEPNAAQGPVELTPPANQTPERDDPFAAAVDTMEAEPQQPDSPPDEQSGPATRTPDVHFVPTPQEVVDRMLELAQVTKDDVVYDLGCGDGRIMVTAAKRYGCRAKGFDIDPKRIQESRENVAKNEVEHLVTIEQADIFELDLTPASVVTLYLLPRLNVRLIPQLKELPPGSRIVSHDFDMRGVEPDAVENLTTEEGISHTIYFWTTPLKIDQAKVDEANELFGE
jgi:SAM-dependent methyltransferase